MNRSIRNAFALGIIIALIGACAETPEPEPGLTVWVLNHAPILEEDLARAKDHATGIFRRAGLRTNWVDCPVPANDGPTCWQTPGPATVLVRILPRSNAAPAHSNQMFAYGLLPINAEFGSYVVVYADAPRRLVKGQDAFRQSIRPVILGLLIAHEIGHLLLATDKHSVAGVMKFPWSMEDLASASRGSLSFTPRQAKRMRAQVRARLRAEKAQLR